MTAVLAAAILVALAAVLAWALAPLRRQPPPELPVLYPTLLRPRPPVTRFLDVPESVRVRDFYAAMARDAHRLAHDDWPHLMPAWESATGSFAAICAEVA